MIQATSKKIRNPKTRWKDHHLRKKAKVLAAAVAVLAALGLFLNLYGWFRGAGWSFSCMEEALCCKWVRILPFAWGWVECVLLPPPLSCCICGEMGCCLFMLCYQWLVAATNLHLCSWPNLYDNLAACGLDGRLLQAAQLIGRAADLTLKGMLRVLDMLLVAASTIWVIVCAGLLWLGCILGCL